MCGVEILNSWYELVLVILTHETTAAVLVLQALLDVNHVLNQAQDANRVEFRSVDPG